MYEVFNWNSSPDPPLTPAKHKRASLSLPPTTDIFAVDDKSDSDTRRPMIQRVASGESDLSEACKKAGRDPFLFVSRMNIVEPLPLVLFSTRSLVGLSPFLSRVLRHYVFHLPHHTLYRRMSRSFNTVRTYPVHFLSIRSSLSDCMILVSGGFYDSHLRVKPRGDQYHATACR